MFCFELWVIYLLIKALLVSDRISNDSISTDISTVINNNDISGVPGDGITVVISTETNNYSVNRSHSISH